ncbi:very-short-patch-repair endonuclease [Arcanobacterium wilhelmae]|uniref:Very-short-patch-repair endonuclease n=1 Tax=Arcanobacterium wilhelmae TaxID=1803177 RepID=A0ABT9NAC4_9ACTO|nr:DUF559 domain-containing protein [Arcanobacterium wilhelmae]MDP9800636.1 very-short-patch-repair endonuclease [Arcanobacterium wilhelmae]WFN90042.1 DUF559 domain-containing protein [Arcanobacterium wilhelmae]
MIPNVYRRHELGELGFVTEAQIARAHRNGVLVRHGHGWYSDGQRDIPEQYRTAMISNTQLGCCSALSEYGLWVPPEETGKIHLALRAGQKKAQVHNAQSKTTVPIISHRGAIWNPEGLWERDKLLMPMEDALEQAVRTHSPLTALVLVESALNLRLVSHTWVEALRARLSKQKSLILRDASPLSESGTETRISHFLRSHRFHFRQQVELLPGIRADILHGHHHVIEADSVAHHAGQKEYEHDRERDCRLQAAGFDVTRVSFTQGWDDWEAFVPLFLQILHRYR